LITFINAKLFGMPCFYPLFKPSFAAALFCLLLQAVLCSGQQRPMLFSQINYDQGLSNSTVETIAQDHRGFIWLGTRDGLNLYDGKQMTVFRHTKNQGSISDNFIKYIYEDKAHTLWIGTINGLNTYDPATKKFRTFFHQPGRKESISGNRINCILEDQQHRLWIATAEGLDILDRKTGNFKSIAHASNPAAEPVSSVFQDRAGRIWVASPRGLSYYDSAQKKLVTSLPDPTVKIKVIQQDISGKLWLATENSGLLLFDPVTYTYKSYRHKDADPASLGNNQVLSLLVDKAGTVWVGTINGGLNIFNPSVNGFVKYSYEPGKVAGISQRTISSIFEDQQGNFWIGTHRGGVNLYNPDAKKFNVFREEPNGDGLSYNDVKCFEEDHLGQVWVGTDGGGLNLFNEKNQTFKTFRNRVNDLSSLSSDAVLDITEDSQRRLWVATWGGGLNLMDAASGTFTRMLHRENDAASISSDFVQNVYEDRNKVLWVGTYFGGLNRFDPVSKRFEKVTTGPSGKSRLKGNNIVAINEDASGNLWIGTDDGGLNRLDKQTRQFSHYFDKEDRKPDIRVIFTDRKKRLWIGQAGLYLFDAFKNRFNLFTSNGGLAHTFIKGITEDQRGNLWIATANGLVKLDPETGKTNTYNTGDGLQAMEFEANAYMKTRNGKMFFGGINGFNTFHPEEIKHNKFVPPVYITGFQLFNQEVPIATADSPLQQDITLTRSITLNYQQSGISFTFAALNYLAPENNTYAYKLIGLDKNFNYTSSGNKAYYTNLSPGEYEFLVIAANNDGVWNRSGTSIKITITPPWWQTWWAKLLLLACVAGSAYAIIRYRHNLQLKKLEEAKKEEVHQLQLEFFTNISHEFRTPLTLILGPLEKLQDTASSPETVHAYQIIYRNAKRLMNLINELMDFRKAESGTLKLNVTPGNITVFLNEILDEFSIWAQQKNIRFTIENKMPDSGDLYFDRQIFEKILLNVINNAFKYTNDGGSIQISLFNEESQFLPSYENELKIANDYTAKRYVYVLVADSGIGISAESIAHLFQRYYRVRSSHLGSGIGLAFVKTLTLFHKGFIRVYSERNKGTEIMIALPVDAEDYTADEHWIRDKTYLPEHFNLENYLLIDEGGNAGDADQQPVALDSKYILLVEDNDELRTFIKNALNSQYTILEAKDGEEGLKMAKEHYPNLIISDIMMPKMNGIELCRQIKTDEATRHIPFILLSAKDALESKLEGVESGADFYFSKPVSINLLLLTLRNIFIQQDKLKERYTTANQAEIIETVHNSKDKNFMDQLVAVIESELTNPAFDVDQLCVHLNMSRTKLYEMIKRLTGQSIIEFIRTIRLNKAVYIMTHEDVSISEVIFRVGIQTQSYFTKAFKKEFGKTPSQFLNELKK
jgi:ligand-binding sensor domain-containing protein/signal transduction histidine kinase/DNA-binding response OmpR family regulator